MGISNQPQFSTSRAVTQRRLSFELLNEMMQVQRQYSQAELNIISHTLSYLARMMNALGGKKIELIPFITTYLGAEERAVSP